MWPLVRPAGAGRRGGEGDGERDGGPAAWRGFPAGVRGLCGVASDETTIDTLGSAAAAGTRVLSRGGGRRCSPCSPLQLTYRYSTEYGTGEYEGTEVY